MTQGTVPGAIGTALPSGPPGSPPPPGFASTLSSEWAKLRTLRSTPITLAVAAALVIGFGALITWGAFGAPAHHGHRTVTDPVGVIEASWLFGVLALAVLGVLLVTNEYSSGMIASTFLATPKRSRVLAAKVAVFSVVICVVAEAVSVIDFFVGHAVISAFPQYYDPNLTGHNVLRAVLGMGLNATLSGLMGVGLGALLRNAAGAIAIAVGIGFVAPIVMLALPASIQNPLNEYWPTQAGQQVGEVARQAHSLTAWWGLADFFAFVLVLLGLSAYALTKRDA
ncbi:MAG TPA: ABC transporter permease [Acidimicrobiales bacterium]|nr:ABC transporter permease [Acidimicrobiales bacterium]